MSYLYVSVTDALESNGLGVLAEVCAERVRQDDKWGPQNHPDGTGRPGDVDMATLDRAKCKANGPDQDNWRDILQEEISEAFAETDPILLRAELVQVAAVAVAWAQAIDRRQTQQDDTHRPGTPAGPTKPAATTPAEVSDGRTEG